MGEGTMIVDVAELRSQTFDDDDLLREIVTMFSEQTPELLAALEAANGAGRSEIAHRLKGSALALGARALADLAARIEKAPDEGALIVEARLVARETIAELQAIGRSGA